MIAQAQQLLAQPPWCFHPDQIATLTDWQIEHLYIRPAIERAQRPSRPRPEMQNRPRVVQPKASPGSAEFREWVIEQFLKMGMTRSTAEQQFEEQGRNFHPSEMPS